MATKNKKDIIATLNANIYPNTNREVTALKTRAPFSDTFNSVSVNITVAQLQAEDDSAESSLANIIDPGKQGVFCYDSLDVTAVDDNGGGCIVTSTNRRFKRLIERSIDARWYGAPNYYFANPAAAKTAIKAFTRFIGLEVSILLNTKITTYWFKDGIADGNLVVKVSEPHNIEFTVGDGGPVTPNDGDTNYINTDLAGATILGFWISGRKVRVTIAPAVLTTPDIYIQFDPTIPEIFMKNGVFTTDNDYSIMYK